jgi:hypothetical protein
MASSLMVSRPRCIDVSRVMRWIGLVITVSTLAAGVRPASAEQRAKRHGKQIVVLYTHRTLTPINADWDRGIRSVLAAGLQKPLDLEIEYLNLVRHQDPDYLKSWIQLLKTKYAANPPDLVIPVYVPALEFTLEQRDAIFPNVPIVFCSAHPKLAERARTQLNGLAWHFVWILQGPSRRSGSCARTQIGWWF